MSLTIFKELAEAGQTPGGIPIVDAKIMWGFHALASRDAPVNTDTLSLDLMSPVWLGKHARFGRIVTDAETRILPSGGTIRLEPLMTVLKRKLTARTEPKDKRDVQLIEQFYRGQGAQSTLALASGLPNDPLNCFP